MTVTDQTAVLRGLLADALGEQAFGEDIGFDVSWTPGAGTDPPFYHLLFTMSSPLLGQPPLHAMTSIQAAAPHEIGEDGARELAAGVVRRLRSDRAAVLGRVN